MPKHTCRDIDDLTNEEYELLSKAYCPYVERWDSYSFAAVETFRQSAIDHMAKEGLIVKHPANPRLFKLTDDGYSMVAFSTRN